MSKQRGKVVTFTLEEMAARALALATVPDDPDAKIMYTLLKGKTGGKDPEFATCAHVWRDNTMKPPRVWHTGDCVALAAWATGYDRKQVERLHFYGGWCNPTSMILEAIWQQTGTALAKMDHFTGEPFYKMLDKPVIGCHAVVDAVTIPSMQPGGKPKRRAGHVGIVTGFDKQGTPLITHLSPSNHERASKQGIMQTTLKEAMGSTRKVYYMVVPACIR